MSLQVVNMYSVVDDDSKGYKIGFRNLFNSRGDHMVEVRAEGREIAILPLEDFKKLLITGERLADLLSNDEENSDATSGN